MQPLSAEILGTSPTPLKSRTLWHSLSQERKWLSYESHKLFYSSYILSYSFNVFSSYRPLQVTISSWVKCSKLQLLGNCPFCPRLIIFIFTCDLKKVLTVSVVMFSVLFLISPPHPRFPFNLAKSFFLANLFFSPSTFVSFIHTLKEPTFGTFCRLSPF